MRFLTNSNWILLKGIHFNLISACSKSEEKLNESSCHTQARHSRSQCIMFACLHPTFHSSHLMTDQTSHGRFMWMMKANGESVKGHRSHSSTRSTKTSEAKASLFVFALFSKWLLQYTFPTCEWSKGSRSCMSADVTHDDTRLC